MTNPFFDLLGVLFSVTIIVGSLTGAVLYVDYTVSSQAVVNAINKECGTKYERIDYLRVGPETMRDLCRIKEQRVKLQQEQP